MKILTLLNTEALAALVPVRMRSLRTWFCYSQWNLLLETCKGMFIAYDNYFATSDQVLGIYSDSKMCIRTKVKK